MDDTGNLPENSLNQDQRSPPNLCNLRRNTLRGRGIFPTGFSMGSLALLDLTTTIRHFVNLLDYEISNGSFNGLCPYSGVSVSRTKGSGGWSSWEERGMEVG